MLHQILATLVGCLAFRLPSVLRQPALTVQGTSAVSRAQLRWHVQGEVPHHLTSSASCGAQPHAWCHTCAALPLAACAMRASLAPVDRHATQSSSKVLGHAAGSAGPQQMLLVSEGCCCKRQQEPADVLPVRNPSAAPYITAAGCVSEHA